MDQSKGKALQLDADHAAFIQGAVSVVVSSRNSQHVPDVVRGCGCRVSRDRRRVTVLVEAARTGSVLDDIATNGLIAVVFSQPSTHRTIQLKGSDARITRVTGADRGIAQRHLRAWVQDLQLIGYAADFARAVRGEAPDLVAVTFTLAAAYLQTPGPAAGQRLEQ
ncbi:MAG: hypothetical protein NTU56_00200 [Proteobacteria bacterium]|nr:hypothetical protein [Pseudomonadota bacterium]